VDGDHGVTVVGGLWAIVAATLSATTASGSISTDLQSRTLYFPNVTRTLGGPTGWTTPIAIQGTGTTNATLKWYRFSDGALVYTQVLIFNEFGQTFKVDPRQIPDLADNTQYAVVATSGFRGMTGVVTELNFSGGDGAMNYEGVEPPSSIAFGINGCEPQSAPAGSTFLCTFYGFPAGAQPSSLTVTNPSGPPTTSTPAGLVGANGIYAVGFGATQQGVRTLTVTVGTQSQSASFTVTPQSFPITITESTFGSVTANTRPGIACTLFVTLPNGQALTDPGLSTRVSSAQGNVAWVYTKPPGTAGTGRHLVECTSGAESPNTFANFTAP
jgi:hypothetical protein